MNFLENPAKSDSNRKDPIFHSLLFCFWPSRKTVGCLIVDKAIIKGQKRERLKRIGHKKAENQTQLQIVVMGSPSQRMKADSQENI